MGNVYVPPPNLLLGTGGQVALEVLGLGSESSPTVGIFNGDWEVTGTSTTIKTVDLQVTDKNIELAVVDTPTDSTADGGGITLKGATDKTITWQASSSAWHFNQGINLISGNFGIGTSSASRPLSIVTTENEVIRLDNSVSGGDCVINYRTSFGTDVNWAAGIKGSDDSWRISNSTNVGTNDRLVISSGGNVGLGVSQPSVSLDVFGTGAFSSRVGIGTKTPAVDLHIKSTSDPIIQLERTGVTKWNIIGHGGPNYLGINQDGVGTHLVIAAGGNVGIGTTSPTVTCDVVGDFKCSGTVDLGGVVYAWPSSDGADGRRLTTDGSGALSWAPGGASGSTTFTLSDGTNTTVIADEDTFLVTGGRGISATVSTDAVTLNHTYTTENITLTSGSPTATGSSGKDLYSVNADTVGGTFTIPHANSMGATSTQTVPIWVKNTNSSNSMTLKTAGGNIDATVGSAGIVLNSLASILLVSDGSNFHVL
jgi:hypothetical protein